MGNTTRSISRRGFLQAGVGGVGAGGLWSLGLPAAAAEMKPYRLAETRQVPSVCPYCAVGCSLLISERDGQLVNIEGNPDSPINAGTLCPKGAATFQLAVNPHRITKVWYRAPGAREWDKTKTLEWAMHRIAERVKGTRDATFQETWQTTDAEGNSVERRVNHTVAIASLGGATMDNEWNYVQAKLMRALGVVNIENQARI